MNELLYNNDALKASLVILFMYFTFHFSNFKWDRVETIPAITANYFTPAYYLTNSTVS